MLKEGKFGPQEAISLITITIVSQVFFTSPSALTNYVGTASWYMTLISDLTAIIGFSFLFLLLKRFPGRDIVDIFNMSFGKLIGSIISIIMSLYLLLNASIITREFSEVMKVYVLPLSPTSYISGIVIICVVIMGVLGLETIARVSRLLAPFLLICFIIGIILASQNFSIHRLSPILGYGIGPTIIHGIKRSSVYGYVFIIAIIASSLQGNSHIKKIGLISLILSGALISLALLSFTLTFPYYVANEITAPIYQMTALIDYGRFIQRLDALFLFIWNLGTLICVSVILYAAASTYCKIFNIEDIKPVIISYGILAFTTSLIPNDITSIIYGYVDKIREFGWIVFYIPPIIALTCSIVRNKGGENRSA